MHSDTASRNPEISITCRAPANAAATASPSFSNEPVLLMCAPELYDVQYVINPWMEGNLHRSSRDRALTQWQALYDELAPLARVLLIPPVAGWPDMVFTANAGLIRGRCAAVSRFFHPERQGEEPHFRQWFLDRGYDLLEIAPETPFEGEGDALFAEQGELLWAGYGPRTSSASHAALAAAWRVEVVGLHLVDPRFYHLDTCFAPLTGGYLVYYPEAFSAASRAEIEAFYPADKRIAVREADAVCFACNAVNLGQTIVMNTISDDLRERLTTRGFRVVEVALDEFLKAGGAAKCLVLKLYPPLHPLDAGAAGVPASSRAVLPSAVELLAMSTPAAEPLEPTPEAA